MTKEPKEEKSIVENKVQEENKERFQLGQVPGVAGDFVIDTEKDNQVLEDKEVQLEILNRLEKIDKSLG